jgi:hypothetical protein
MRIVFDVDKIDKFWELGGIYGLKVKDFLESIRVVHHKNLFDA